MARGRRGREQECRAPAAEALELCARAAAPGCTRSGSTAALGELELGLGEHGGGGPRTSNEQRELLADLAITDVDLSPAPELVDAYLRLGRTDDARTAAASSPPRRARRASRGRWRAPCAAKSPSVADEPVELFEQALVHHSQTADAFEEARTRLAYGERLRRTAHRVLAREQLRAAAQAFERLDAAPWADRAATEFAATGRDASPSETRARSTS